MWFSESSNLPNEWRRKWRDAKVLDLKLRRRFPNLTKIFRMEALFSIPEAWSYVPTRNASLSARKTWNYGSASGWKVPSFLSEMSRIHPGWKFPVLASWAPRAFQGDKLVTGSKFRLLSYGKAQALDNRKPVFIALPKNQGRLRSQIIFCARTRYSPTSWEGSWKTALQREKRTFYKSSGISGRKLFTSMALWLLF